MKSRSLRISRCGSSLKLQHRHLGPQTTFYEAPLALRYRFDCEPRMRHRSVVPNDQRPVRCRSDSPPFSPFYAHPPIKAVATASCPRRGMSYAVVSSNCSTHLVELPSAHAFQSHSCQRVEACDSPPPPHAIAVPRSIHWTTVSKRSRESLESFHGFRSAPISRSAECPAR